MPFALTVCNNSYVFALKTSNVNASFKYKKYLGLAKWELMVPAQLLSGHPQKRHLVDAASPGGGFDVKSVSPWVSWNLQTAEFVQLCQNRVEPFFPFGRLVQC